jgi:hypothetical protein
MATASSSKFPKLPKTKGLKMIPLSLHLTKNLLFFLFTALDNGSSTLIEKSTDDAPQTSIVYRIIDVCVTVLSLILTVIVLTGMCDLFL